jgi:hypothetical protein
MMLKTKPRRGAFDYLLDDLPPRPPERGGGGARIRIEIEITDRRAQQARPRVGVLQLLAALILLMLLFGGLAHAQPRNWQSYQLGGTPYYQGTDQDGGNWSGSSYRLGGTRYFDAYGPNGQAQHCSSYRLGSTTYTDCRRADQQESVSRRWSLT